MHSHILAYDLNGQRFQMDIGFDSLDSCLQSQDVQVGVYGTNYLNVFKRFNRNLFFFKFKLFICFSITLMNRRRGFTILKKKNLLIDADILH